MADARAGQTKPLLARIAVPGSILGGALLLTLLATWAGALEGMELFLYDLRAKGGPAKIASDRLLPYPIDEASIDRMGRWPWPRPVLAGVARSLSEAGARVVLLDITYRSFTTPEEDAAFAEEIARATAVVTAYGALPIADPNEERTEDVRRSIERFEARVPVAIEGADLHLPEAPEAARLFLPISSLIDRFPSLGLATTTKDRDGKVRRVPLLFRYRPSAGGPARWLPSLPLMLACRWYGVEPSALRVEPARLVIPGAAGPGEAKRDVRIPVDRGGRMLVHYARAGLIAARFQSLYQLRGALEGDPRARPKVKDRVPLIYLAESSGDVHSTPTATNFPGGLINAEALNTILQADHVHVPPRWTSLLLFASLAAAMLAFSLRWRSYRLAVAWLSLVFGLFVVAFSLFNAASLMVPLAPAAVFATVGGAGVVVWRTWIEERERVDLMFTLRALQNQALKERAAQKAAADATASPTDAAEVLRRNVDYGRFIESLRDIEKLENTYIGKHYRLMNLIDEGGMGLVFRAYDEALGRVVAIKVLTRYSAKLLKRFQVEAKAVGQIDHPNVVQVYAVAAEGDIPYIVMEYVDGTSLSHRIRNDGPLPVVDALEVIVQVARGLDAAHVRQVVHRDIKTSNILLTKDGTAKIIDFGIAKIFKGEEGLTGEKEIVGTADYMSPEQGMGKQVDLRSDIYSLGITLYRVLTGKLPFRADDTVAVLMKQMKEALPDVRQARPDVPDEVVRILHKMTEKRADDRYPSCRELCAELESCLRTLRAGGGGAERLRSPFGGGR